MHCQGRTGLKKKPPWDDHRWLLCFYCSSTFVVSDSLFGCSASSVGCSASSAGCSECSSSVDLPLLQDVSTVAPMKVHRSNNKANDRKDLSRFMAVVVWVLIKLDLGLYQIYNFNGLQRTIFVLLPAFCWQWLLDGLFLDQYCTTSGWHSILIPFRSYEFAFFCS